MTPIDKLYNEIEKAEQYHVYSLATETVKVLLDEIKEQHKEDVVKAYKTGDIEGDVTNLDIADVKRKAEQYYNENFKQ